MTIDQLKEYGFVVNETNPDFYNFIKGKYDYSVNSVNMFCCVGRDSRGYDEEMCIPVNDKFIELIEFLAKYE